MEKKLFRKKLLILLMIISIVATDFFILGSNLITYSSDISDVTNNPNVEFSAYFKNDINQQTDSIEKNINSENIRLYVEIKVKNEGYLNEGAIIEIANNNFNIKNNILSSYVKEISGNKVTLKQITAGENIEIPLEIEPIILEKLSVDMLTRVSTVKLNGSYTGTTNSGIQYAKEVCVTFQPDENMTAELETEIITNKILSVNGTNKRVVQLLVKSRLSNNGYPVKQTIINADIPEVGEQTPEIKAMAVSELATNGKTEIDSMTTENGKVTVVLNNEPDANNEIKWIKNAFDEIVITYIYPETVEVNDVYYVNASTQVQVYNTNMVYTQSTNKSAEMGQTIPEPNNVIIGKTEITTEEMYKGKLYANIDAQYNTKTSIVVTNENVVDTITVNEVEDVFTTAESELTANAKYVTTEVNLQKMIEILGTDGEIQINNGETTTTINKDTVANENGNVVISHGDTTTTEELVITTSKPVNTGRLEIYHTKTITENSYTRAQLQTVKTLNAKNTTIASLNGTKILENITETATLELKETVSKAELKIENNKNTLSTTDANDVILGITLITDGEQYDLFKNPEISIQLPSAVESLDFNTNLNKQNADEFEISELYYDENTKRIKVKLNGEQTTYPESELTQTYLQLNFNVTLSQLVANHTDKITMTYTNENATQYYNGTTDVGVMEQAIKVGTQPGLLKMFNINMNEDTSLTDTIKQTIEQEDAGNTLIFETILVNNTDSNMNDVRILGKLPTTGNTITEQEENTLETTLESINATNAKIYYTENTTATDDIENTANGWTTDFLENAKLYLIRLETLSKGSNYTATVKVKLPTTIEQSLISYTEYKVIYDTELATNIEETSRKIALVTSALQIELTAKVGQDELMNGDIVKEGEVIKYIAKLTNSTEQTIENIELIAVIPEGTVGVKPIEDYEYSLGQYYEEKTDIREVSKTIQTLSVGQKYTLEYEVRVNTDITAGTEISNQIQVTYNNKTTKSSKLTNEIEEANIRVTMKKAIDESIKLTTGSEVKYNVIIENLSNENINGLGMKIISDDFILEEQEGILGEISANDKVSLKIKGKIINDPDISVVITDSNNSYRSNVVKENILAADATITLTSPQNNASLKQGDIVEYKIVAKNTGSINEYFKVYYSISNDFEVQAVSVNGTAIGINNLIYEGINLDVGEEAVINITAKVKSIEETKVITNKAKVEVLNVYKDISEEITHTLSTEKETTQPDNPDNPNNPDDSTQPTDPENPNNPTDPEQTEDKKTISGLAWLDLDRNGKKDTTDTVLSGIKVKIYDVSTKNYLVDNEGKVVEVETNSNGKYTFTNIEKGTYILIFEYNTEEYEPTIYFAEGVDTSVNSQVILKKININGKEITAAVTSTIEVKESISNLNIGLKEKLAFDLELGKYISKIVVQTNKTTKAYDYENSTFEKVEIHRKQIQGTLVVFEYTIKVKNNGEIAGYVRNIVDYIPSGLTFSSELNSDWYASGNYLYTKGLENVQIKPGEEKEIKLILTKVMNEQNVGLINNRAEINQDYNKYGEADIDSTPNNQNQSEDDYGSVDIIIGVSTGGSIIMYIGLIFINLILVYIAIKLMIKNNIIQISYKKERR